MYFENQSSFIKRKRFGGKRFGQTIFSEGFNMKIHGSFVGGAEFFFFTQYRTRFECKADFMGMIGAVF